MFVSLCPVLVYRLVSREVCCNESAGHYSPHRDVDIDNSPAPAQQTRRRRNDVGLGQGTDKVSRSGSGSSECASSHSEVQGSAFKSADIVHVRSRIWKLLIFLNFFSILKKNIIILTNSVSDMEIIRSIQI